MRRLLIIGALALLASGCERSPIDPGPDPGRDYRVGELYQFNVNLDTTRAAVCDVRVERTARVVAVTARTVIAVDTQSPAGEGTFTDEEYRQFGEHFDVRIHPTITQNFGQPVPMSGNQRMVILFTPAVNALTPPHSGFAVGGAFHPRDLWPTTTRTVNGVRLAGCPGSNQSEMFYMPVPDPARLPTFAKETLRRRTPGVLAHEFQHLINSSRRLFVSRGPVEEVWLNEGLSHIAEELMFYGESGTAPRQNINFERLRSSQVVVNAFNAYQSENFSRLNQYLANHASNSPYAPNDALATRGAIWLFLRYAADRQTGSQSDFWARLVTSTEAGLPNLQAALGSDLQLWFRDWSIATYASDAVPGAAAQYQHPSWNLRSVISGLIDGAFPLRTSPLANNLLVRPSIRAGTAEYLRFGVAPGARAAVWVTTGEVGGADPCQATPAIRLELGQVHAAPPGTGGGFCLEGGTVGADFTLIPYHASSADGFLVVNVLGQGIRSVVAQVSLGTARVASSLAQIEPHAHHAAESDEWHLRLQEHAWAELGRRTPGFSGVTPHAFATSSSVQNTTPLAVSFVRTR
jgi:hypothetical protein